MTRKNNTLIFERSNRYNEFYCEELKQSFCCDILDAFGLPNETKKIWFVLGPNQDEELNYEIDELSNDYIYIMFQHNIELYLHKSDFDRFYRKGDKFSVWYDVFKTKKKKLSFKIDLEIEVDEGYIEYIEKDFNDDLQSFIDSYNGKLKRL